MTRLTNAMREQVVDAFYRETITPRREAFEKKLTAACQKAADGLHPPKVKKWLDDMPKEAGNIISTLGSVLPCRDDGTNLRDIFKEGSLWQTQFRISLPKPVYCPAGMQHSKDLVLPNGQALADELQSIYDDWRFLKSTLREALYACTTVKQLKEKYPVIAEKLPAVEKQTKALAITQDAVAEAIKCAGKGGCK